MEVLLCHLYGLAERTWRSNCFWNERSTLSSPLLLPPLCQFLSLLKVLHCKHFASQVFPNSDLRFSFFMSSKSVTTHPSARRYGTESLVRAKEDWGEKWDRSLIQGQPTWESQFQNSLQKYFKAQGLVKVKKIVKLISNCDSLLITKCTLYFTLKCACHVSIDT